MRPEDPQQEGVGGIRIQPQLSVSVHSEDSVQILHLRHAGLSAPREGPTRVPQVRNTQGGEAGRVGSGVHRRLPEGLPEGSGGDRRVRQVRHGPLRRDRADGGRLRRAAARARLQLGRSVGPRLQGQVLLRDGISHPRHGRPGRLLLVHLQELVAEEGRVQLSAVSVQLPVGHQLHLHVPRDSQRAGDDSLRSLQSQGGLDQHDQGRLRLDRLLGGLGGGLGSRTRRVGPARPLLRALGAGTARVSAGGARPRRPAARRLGGRRERLQGAVHVRDSQVDLRRLRGEHVRNGVRRHRESQLSVQLRRPREGTRLQDVQLVRVREARPQDPAQLRVLRRRGRPPRQGVLRRRPQAVVRVGRPARRAVRREAARRQVAVRDRDERAAPHVHLGGQVRRGAGLAGRMDGGPGDHAERAVRAVRLPEVGPVHIRQARVQQGGELRRGRQQRRAALSEARSGGGDPRGGLAPLGLGVERRRASARGRRRARVGGRDAEAPTAAEGAPPRAAAAPSAAAAAAGRALAAAAAALRPLRRAPRQRGHRLMPASAEAEARDGAERR